MVAQTAEQWTAKRCRSCEGGMEKFTPAEAHAQIESLVGWRLCRDGQRIEKHWHVRDFIAGIRFFEAIAALAEKEGHHPDLHLEGYRHVWIELWSMPWAGCRRTTSSWRRRSTNCRWIWRDTLRLASCLKGNVALPRRVCACRSEEVFTQGRKGAKEVAERQNSTTFLLSFALAPLREAFFPMTCPRDQEPIGGIAAGSPSPRPSPGGRGGQLAQSLPHGPRAHGALMCGQRRG